MSLKEEFESAKEKVKHLPERPGNDALLELYALFKQATEEDNNGKRPGMFDMVGRKKYDAWAGKKGLSKDAAMKEYAEVVKRLENS